MKFYITKYALTKGIIEIEGEISKVSETMVKTKNYSCYHKPYWHLTIEEAIEHAESLRTNRVKSLEKQLAKLKSLKF